MNMIEGKELILDWEAAAMSSIEGYCTVLDHPSDGAASSGDIKVIKKNKDGKDELSMSG